MKYIQKILLAIIISAPISVFVSLIGESFLIWILGLERNNTDTFPTLITLPIFYAIFYIICGLPTTLIADGLLRFKSLAKYSTVIQLLVYTLSGLILSLILSDYSLKVDILVIVLTPVYVYWYVLLMIRKKSC